MGSHGLVFFCCLWVCVCVFFFFLVLFFFSPRVLILKGVFVRKISRMFKGVFDGFAPFVILFVCFVLVFLWLG